MKISTHSAVPVYTIAGSSTARPLPDWLARKRKRSLKNDPEFSSRVELLQDFSFDEASQCIRVSEDGDWVMSTGTYKPQMHVHYLPHLSLSWARHTNTLNQTFLLLSDDYSKSLHLQSDRALEFHTPAGRHYATRIPRYGRDLALDRRAAEALIPAAGINADGFGEVFRLNLEVGRFMRAYEVDVGGAGSADAARVSSNKALQGGVDVGSVNTAAVAEQSHNLLAFGTSLGTVEFWDSRSRSRVGALAAPAGGAAAAEFSEMGGRPEITSLAFHPSGLTVATGDSAGMTRLYDLRSPRPLLTRDQGYGYPVHTLSFLCPSTASAQAPTTSPKILTADKRIIKLWEPDTGAPWTSVEPAVDLNHVAWVPDSGMLLTANEGQAQHAFFVPQLGPAPRWCAFLDNLVEEMAEDAAADPSGYTASVGGAAVGSVYDNYKFLTLPQLRALSLDHLVGRTRLLRPYMHGFFVAQRLYEEARLIAKPELWREQREKSIKERVEKERESRIRGGKKAGDVKVNRKLAEKLAAKEEARERRRARRIIERGGDDDVIRREEQSEKMDMDEAVENGEQVEEEQAGRGKSGLLHDPRFANLFRDEDFAINEESAEWKVHNPVRSGANAESGTRLPKGLTAVEREEMEAEEGEGKGLSDDESEDESDEDEEGAMTAAMRHKAEREKKRDVGRISSSSYRKSGLQRKGQQKQQPKMTMLLSETQPQKKKERSFGSQLARTSDGGGRAERRKGGAGMVKGEREIVLDVGGKSMGKGQLLEELVSGLLHLAPKPPRGFAFIFIRARSKIKKWEVFPDKPP
ncbi:hypothetical protein BDY21DRAFT_382502 [Lineolata rhizophorae]|uniref:Uncharacterized protein n=1 Tax=Lineolata rhizophorae TaxID=578093 RepID=A0A6A6NMI4_9PEZI|nr:hypothetical protein BDY21DRAFT_382502 [Lineolata rhizophorae]